MQVRVLKIDENGVVLPIQVAETLRLVEGAQVEVQTAPATETVTRGIRYATPDEAMRAHQETVEEYRDVYRELAK